MVLHLLYPSIDIIIVMWVKYKTDTTPTIMGMYVSTAHMSEYISVGGRCLCAVSAKKTQQVAYITCFSDGECTFYSVHFQGGFLSMCI